MLPLFCIVPLRSPGCNILLHSFSRTVGVTGKHYTGLSHSVTGRKKCSGVDLGWKGNSKEREKNQLKDVVEEKPNAALLKKSLPKLANDTALLKQTKLFDEALLKQTKLFDAAEELRNSEFDEPKELCDKKRSNEATETDGQGPGKYVKSLENKKEKEEISSMMDSVSIDSEDTELAVPYIPFEGTEEQNESVSIKNVKKTGEGRFYYLKSVNSTHKYPSVTTILEGTLAGAAYNLLLGWRLNQIRLHGRAKHSTNVKSILNTGTHFHKVSFSLQCQ